MESELSENFSIVLQGLLIALAFISLGLVTYERWFRSGELQPESNSRALFGSPLMRFGSIALLVLLAVRGVEGDTVAITAVATIAATVAGADFVLLLYALVANRETFIREFFQTQRSVHAVNARQSADIAADVERRRAPVDDDVTPASPKELRKIMFSMPDRAQVLWVDDEPLQNHEEARALVQRGFDVDLMTTNDEAIEAYRKKDYDVVISDIARGTEKPQAGLDLPGLLRQTSSDQAKPPLVYYVKNRLAQVSPEGYPVCVAPSELFAEVSRILQQNSGRLAA